MRHEPRIIRIGPDDTGRAVALHRRCSAYTLWSRYHRAMGDPRSYLGALLSRPGSVHLAVRGPSGRLIALGHLMPDDGNAEVALLVEDEWQNHGWGTRLLRHLGAHAVGRGWSEVHGLVLPGNEQVLAMLRRSVVPVREVRQDGVRTVLADTDDIARALAPRWARAAGAGRARVRAGGR